MTPKRDYRAILLEGEAFADSRRATRLFAANRASFRKVNGVRLRDVSLEVQEITVYSEQIYARSAELLASLRAARRTQGAFEFSGYSVIYRRGGLTFALLGLPFFGLMREVARGLDEAVRGDAPYRALDLDMLVGNVLQGQHLGGRLTVRALEFDVRGDDDVSRMTFRGTNTLYSKVYKRVTGSLQGIRLLPRACSVIYDDHEGARVLLEADKFGNFVFRAGNDAESLLRLSHLFDYAVDTNILIRRTLDPTRRAEAALLESGDATT